MKRLLALFALTTVAAVLLIGPARRLASRPAPVGTTNASPRAALTLFVAKDGVEPVRSEVPKDHRVALSIANHSGRPATIVLTGYEGRVDIGTLEDGATWMGAFVSDLPGDDFAWLVNGQVAGRLAVTGSHLTEGRR